MKFFGLFSLIIYTVPAWGQSPPSIANIESTSSKFKLSLTIWNHAERLFKGETTYALTDTSIEVINTIFKGNRIVRFSKILPSSANRTNVIKNIALDSIATFYSNNCIATGSGNEYILDYEDSSKKKANTPSSLLPKTTE